MLLRCIKGIKSKRVIVSALVVIIILGSITGAVFTAPVTVYALSAGGIKSTIASLVISLLLQTGVAPTNQQWLTQLNNAYGVESTIGTIENAISNGLLTETAEGLVDTGLSDAIMNVSEYTSLGLDDLFTTTVNDAGVIAGSGAVNLANTAIHVGKAGTIGAFAGAVAVGVGVGVLANKFIDWAGKSIKAGISYFNVPNYLNELGQGSSFAEINYGATKQYSYLLPGNCRMFYYIEQGGALDGYVNARMVSKTMGYDYYYKAKGGVYTKSHNSGNTLSSSYNPPFGNIVNFIRCNNAADLSERVNDYINGDYVPNPLISPDIVTPVGNAYYGPDENQNDDYQGIGNIIPEGSDMTPVDMDDYQDYINNANNNTSQGNTGQEIQGEAFDEFVDPYIVAAPTIPDQPIIPENPDEVPEVPDRPTVPDQPTIPDKPNIDQETLDKALEGATTIDLRAIFPFCIPFDLYNLLLIFDTGENRKAPHITFTFPFTGWVIDVDLAPFDPVAGILRLLELILFIIGLAVATRSLIGAGGGS